MPYELRFKTEAVKEWDKPGATVRAQSKKKLTGRLIEPHGPTALGSNTLDLLKIHHYGAI